MLTTHLMMEFVLLEIPFESVPPLIIIAVLFIFGFLMGTLAQILTQRVMIDVIPNKIRNSVYSLQPTLVMIVAIPLMLISGDMISRLGFPPVFVILAGLAVIGVLLIREAFKHPIPSASDIKDSVQDEEEIQLIGEPLQEES
ncbi:MAG: hypothetical protein P1Q69_09095 [Candidatus Thorarchaeota archaeon]|nr:hypothetical protein [Candidatus Thorarchaeota archaeon]